MDKIDKQQAADRMYYQKPGEQAVKAHKAVQDAAAEMVGCLIDNCPNPSRELGIAVQKVEEARMWANAAIAHGPRKSHRTKKGTAE